ncbi:hypothetical protein [Saccharopolyspora hattusasensis]|uniref:hypothetical protein n=1 Tax=Saccharopolyspora hattusasensis TaxID=1128679 RepID=UPI003D98025B
MIRWVTAVRVSSLGVSGTTRCCWPPDNFAGRASAWPPIPSRASTSRTAESAIRRDASSAGSVTFCRTVSVGSSRACHARAYRERVAEKQQEGSEPPDEAGPVLTVERIVAAAIALADRDGVLGSRCGARLPSSASVRCRCTATFPARRNSAG